MPHPKPYRPECMFNCDLLTEQVKLLVTTQRPLVFAAQGYEFYSQCHVYMIRVLVKVHRKAHSMLDGLTSL